MKKLLLITTLFSSSIIFNMDTARQGIQAAKQVDRKIQQDLTNYAMTAGHKDIRVLLWPALTTVASLHGLTQTDNTAARATLWTTTTTGAYLTVKGAQALWNKGQSLPN